VISALTIDAVFLQGRRADRTDWFIQWLPSWALVEIPGRSRPAIDVRRSGGL